MSAEAFPTVTTEGGLLPADTLGRIGALDRNLTGLRPEDYHLDGAEDLREAISRSWTRLVTAWHRLQGELEHLPSDDPATTATRERFLLPLFQELGYGRLPSTGRSLEAGDRVYAVSHLYGHVPIHLLGARISLETRTDRIAGAAKASPHGLLQDFLNRSDGHLWGLLTNGLQLRLLRDHHSLTQQAYVEFDLESMFEGGHFSDFALLWLVCHQSRLEAATPEDTWLERWFQIARDEGVRALDDLRDGVERAIAAFGAGFLRHPSNAALRQALTEGTLDRQDYYRQLLRLVYRLIFLFAAEDRDLLLDPDASEHARSRYRRFYATRRLRELAGTMRGGPHGDLWQGLALVMHSLADGATALALPGLGSFLWSDAAVPDLREAELANEDLLTAIRHLSYLQRDGVRYPVAWRAVAADELGSIYESLLELHPELHAQAAVFELKVAAGNERKKTGSYYTPPSLVACLLDTALDPVLDEAVAGKPSAEAERALLDLKICDPACGSGHFLVAAARRTAARLAHVRTGDDEPSPTELRHALRDVVGRCLYGVDINPMAVELCKVALWMEALEPGRPLSFLDHHIQAGNAVIGATMKPLMKGIPEGAFQALEGDDPDVAKRLNQRNKDERKGQTTLTSRVAVASPAFSADFAGEVARIESESDDALESIAQKEQHWRQVTASSSFRAAWLHADVWTAAFFWPKQPGASELHAPTHAVWQAIHEDGAAPSSHLQRTVRKLAWKHSFFHWHLAFPQVFLAHASDAQEAACTGGFDVVLGNPPWDTLSPDTKEFFSRHAPEIRSEDKNGQERIISRLLEDSAIAQAWAEYRRALYSEVHFIKNSGRFKLFAPGNLGKGDFNVYRMFAEAALGLVRKDGRIAQVVPEGIYNGANCMAIRRELFIKCKIELILGFENQRRHWFSGIHGSTKFAIYAAQHSGSTATVHAAFNIRTDAQLAEARSSGLLSIPVDLVHEFSPDALAIMEFRSQRDIDIAKKMYERHPKFGTAARLPLERKYSRELDMGTDRALFSEDPGHIPLYEGRMVSQYDHRAKGYRSGRGRRAKWAELPFGKQGKSIQPQWRVDQANVPSKILARYQRFRIGFCDVASPTNERSLVATLIPPNTICGHKVPTLTFCPDFEWAYLIWLAAANSHTVDFLARKKVSLSMSFTILDSLPFPRLTRNDPRSQHIVPRVLRLICTSDEMVPFWDDMAEAGWVDKRADSAWVPGAIDPEERRQLQAELDGYVAKSIYGLTRDELDYVLDTFPIIARRDVAQFGSYRTKEMVLAAFDKAPPPPEKEEALAMCPEEKSSVPRQSRKSRPASQPAMRAHARTASAGDLPTPADRDVLVLQVASTFRDQDGYDSQRTALQTALTLLANVASEWQLFAGFDRPHYENLGTWLGLAGVAPATVDLIQTVLERQGARVLREYARPGRVGINLIAANGASGLFVPTSAFRRHLFVGDLEDAGINDYDVADASGEPHWLSVTRLADTAKAERELGTLRQAAELDEGTIYIAHSETGSHLVIPEPVFRLAGEEEPVFVYSFPDTADLLAFADRQGWELDPTALQPASNTQGDDDADGTAPQSPAPQEPLASILDEDALSRDERNRLIFTALWRLGPLEKHAAIRTVAESLRDQGLVRFQRLRRDGALYGELHKAIETAVRDDFLDRPRRGYVRAFEENPRHYDLADWRHALLSVVDGEPMDRREALRAAAQWAKDNMGLAFQRLPEEGQILTALRSALNSAIRRGQLERLNAREIRRASEL